MQNELGPLLNCQTYPPTKQVLRERNETLKSMVSEARNLIEGTTLQQLRDERGVSGDTTYNKLNILKDKITLLINHLVRDYWFLYKKEE